SEGSVEAALRWNVLTVSSERPANERLPGSARQQRKSRRLQIAEVADQRIVLLETFSEAKNGIEDDPLAPHACQHGFLRPFLKFAFNQQHDVPRRRQGAP